MKLLRVGEKGKEKPAILDINNVIRDLSSIIKDFDSENLKIDKISKLKNLNLETLPEIKSKQALTLPIKQGYHKTVFLECILSQDNFIRYLEFFLNLLEL